MDKLESKILGCLVGAAAGDAMGAPTEMRTRKQIERKFGGYVNDFREPPEDTFARGRKAGQITDDFSIAYIACQEIVANGGKITPEIGKSALLKWAAIPEYFDHFAGPSTRAAVEQLLGQAKADENGFHMANDNMKASNGAAMKASISLFSGGNIEAAIKNIVIMCKWTHNNNLSLSGAAAVAAATAAAMADSASLYDVVQAGIYGAKTGEWMGTEGGSELGGPSVVERIKLAVTLGVNAASLDDAMNSISNLIGTGLMAAEAVPAVFGLIVAAKGNTKDAILAGVNIGNDTDTVATMAGGILGTLNGIDSLPDGYCNTIDTQNHMDLQKLALQIRKLL